MNIKEAKEEIKHTLLAYNRKDAAGRYTFPKLRQRPVLLMGPPGIGKTAIMEQVAEECNVGLVAYTITHHTRQSAVGLPRIVTRCYNGKEVSITEYTLSEIIASVYDCMERTGKKEGILFIDEINCVSETLAPTMLQFLQNKTFGSHSVPEGWLIAAAGYLNYTGRLFGENAKGTKEANADLTNQELLDISQEDTEAGSEEIESNDSETEGTPGEAVLTNGSAQTTVAQAKVTREQVRAQNKETLQSIIDNTELSEEEKSDAVAQMVELTKQSETEMEIETLMATKGFSEAVVSLGEDSADVVVNAEELTDANRAQIEDIVTRKSDVKPEKIVITPIHE